MVHEAGPDGAVIYEVNLDVEAAIGDAFEAWLVSHVAEMVQLPGFLAARRYEVVEPRADVGRVALCVVYVLRDRAALDAYLRDHAPRMRADGVARFGERFHATRRILSVTSA